MSNGDKDYRTALLNILGYARSINTISKDDASRTVAGWIVKAAEVALAVPSHVAATGETPRADAIMASEPLPIKCDGAFAQHYDKLMALARQLERELAEARAIADRQMNDAEQARIELAEFKLNSERAIGALVSVPSSTVAPAPAAWKWLDNETGKATFWSFKSGEDAKYITCTPLYEAPVSAMGKLTDAERAQVAAAVRLSGEIYNWAINKIETDLASTHGGDFERIHNLRHSLRDMLKIVETRFRSSDD